MDKLQLYINISCQGYRNMLEINADETVRSLIKDISTTVGEVNYRAGEKNIFYILNYVTQGVFITLVRTIPDNKPDHLAAWIFIPYNLNITGSEIVEVVDIIATAVNQPKISSEVLDNIRRVFDREYDVNEQAGAIAPNYGSQYAHRYYGETTGYTLDDLIGKNRYQTSNLAYRGVILIDKDKVGTAKGTDLSDEPLEQMVKLFPPKNDGPYHPVIFGQQFDRPFLAPLMGTVELVWENPGAADIRQSIVVNRPNLRVEYIHGEQKADTPPPTPSLPTQSEDHNKPLFTKPIKSPYKNSGKATENAPVQKPTSEATTNDNNQTPPQPHPHGAIDWKGIVNPMTDTVTKAIWCVTGFVLGIIVALVCTCSGPNTVAVDSESTAENPDSIAQTDETKQEDTIANPVKQTVKKEAPKAPDRSLQAALTYLDNNPVWDRDELESYPDLKGLYYDMNNFNKTQLYSKWKKKLAKSSRFRKVAEHASLGRKKAPRVPQGQKTYNTGDVHTIKIVTYLNTIDP